MPHFISLSSLHLSKNFPSSLLFCDLLTMVFGWLAVLSSVTCLLFIHISRKSTSALIASNNINRGGFGRIVGEHCKETGFYQSIEVKGDTPIYQRRSKYQDISVEQSVHYGKILVLDGVVQLTEKDADSYNEMMAHVPMFSHPNPKRVLVIGGGDGYVLQEVLKHSSVEQVDHVDLDGEVIEVCREHFTWKRAWEDTRVTLHVTDGAAFVRDAANASYDVIIQDSSDPFTEDEDGNRIDLPSGILYTMEHFQNVWRILSPDGIFNFQAETFHIPSDIDGIAEWRRDAMLTGFKDARYGTLMISSYPKGQIGFMLCSMQSQDTLPSFDDVERRFTQIQNNGNGTTYYQPKLQKSSFDLPLWVEKKIYPVTKSSL